MMIHLEKLPDCRASMRVEVPADAVRSERQQVIKLFATQAKIPGFRPGKVPQAVIEKRFQKEIEEELQDRLVRKGCREGIEKEDIDILHVTEVVEPEFHLDDTFTFTAELQTAPEFELPAYEGIDVEVAVVEVNEFDVEHELDHLRERLADYEKIEGRAAEVGDYAVIDYRTELDGKPVGETVEGAAYLNEGEGRWFHLREDALIPGFSEAVAGMNPQEVRDFDLTVPEDFFMEDLQDRKLHFNVTLLEIHKQVLPELDDALAEKVSPGATLEDLKERIRTEIQQSQENKRQEEMTTQILEYLDKHTDFDLPDAIVAGETQRQVNQIVQQSQMRGLPEDQLMEHQESIIQHASTQAEVNVKTEFIIQQIAEKEKIEAEEKEILGYCAYSADQAGVPLKKYINQLKKQDRIGEVVSAIVRLKTLDFLRGNANVTETDRPPHECDNPDHKHE